MDIYQQNQLETKQIRFSKWGRNTGLIMAVAIAVYLSLQGLIFVGENSVLYCFVVYFVSPIFFVFFGTILGKLIGKFSTTQSIVERIPLLVIITLLFFMIAYFVMPIALDFLG